MIVADDIWQNFLSDAQVYCASGEIYVTPLQNGRYTISNIVNEVIHIRRENKPTSGESIGIKKFRTAIGRINSFENKIPKGQIYEHVAEEVTLVELLPFLDWDETGRFILKGGLMADNRENNNLPEAENDSEGNMVQTSVRQRRGQKKFRDKLFSVYGEVCVISSCRIKEVLHACHIKPHSVSGINHSSNGLILRSDLHDLFDQNLIAIEPENLVIHVCESLRDTDYFQYHRHPINIRNDGKRPSLEALQERWRIFNLNP